MWVWEEVNDDKSRVRCVGILDDCSNGFIVSYGCWCYGLGFNGSNTIRLSYISNSKGYQIQDQSCSKGPSFLCPSFLCLYLWELLSEAL